MERNLCVAEIAHGHGARIPGIYREESCVRAAGSPPGVAGLVDGRLWFRGAGDSRITANSCRHAGEPGLAGDVILVGSEHSRRHDETGGRRTGSLAVLRRAHLWSRREHQRSDG